MARDPWVRWYESLPEGTYACERCGKTASKHHINPQYDLSKKADRVICYCDACIRALHAEAKAQRKAQLASMPRCEVPNCTRRATYEVGWDRVGMCGYHLRMAENKLYAEAAASGMPWLPHDYGRAEVLRLAQGGRA